MRLGIAPNLPYDVILVRDWPFFAEVVSKKWNGEEYMEGVGAARKRAWEKSNNETPLCGEHGRGPRKVWAPQTVEFGWSSARGFCTGWG